MKHVLVSIILLGSLSAYGQDGSKNRKVKKEKIEQAKIAFFTQKLELTAEEAEKFWPVYNEMHKKIKESRSTMKKLFEPIKEGKTLSDNEYKNILKSVHEAEEKNLDIKNEFANKTADIIGYKRVFELKIAEKEFKKRLMERMKESKGGKKGTPGRGPRKYPVE